MKYLHKFISRGKERIPHSHEAMSILGEYLNVYRKKSYDELVKLVDDVEAFEMTASSGKAYSLEFMAVWDGSVGEDIRVIGAIDDQGIAVFTPATQDFIISKDGIFIGEDE